MPYTDIGFDQFLNRVEPGAAQTSQSLDPSQTDQLTDAISGSKVQGGLITSPDGKVQLDLENGTFRVNNGIVDLVQLGLLEDGSVGLLLKNSDGQILAQISESTFLFQSANKHMQLDLLAETLTIFNDALVPIVLLGKISD